jgi:excisionase family DNA binding protein
MTVRQFAVRLQVPLSTAYRIVASGAIRSVNISTGKHKRRYRITERAYQAYLTEREMGQGSQWRRGR